VLLVLVLVAIHRGREVQASSKGLTADFRAVNGFFADRANFAAPATAREQLRTLTSVLGSLNDATAEDVDILAETLPDVQRLLQAGRGDVAIALQLNAVAKTLLEAGKGLRQISADADRTTSAADRQVERTKQQLDELDKVLGTIENKLALLPAVPIPPETGTNPILLVGPGRR
jgi:hypothetical protein